jgi:hypothetical protein
LSSIEKTNREAWKLLKGKTLITSAFYAKSFGLTFKRSGAVTTKLDVEREINVNGDLELEWSNEGRVRVASNELLPFGIRGFKIK